MEQHVLPLAALLFIKKVRASDGRLYGLRVVDIHAGLKQECLWIHISLTATVVAESVVVRATDGQLILEGIVAATDVVHHLRQPRLMGQTVIHLEVIYESQTSVGLLCAVKRNQFFQ